MASYGTDLTDITDAESSDTWSEMNVWKVGDDPSEGETDYYIQGSSCASTDTNAKTGLASGCVDAGSDISGSFTNGETVVLIWHVMLPGNAMDTFANGGLRAIVGADVSNYGGWAVGGNDAGRNPYGGWQCYAVDPSKTADYTVGTWTPGTSSYRWFGAATNLIAAIAKGTPHGWDAIRYGRAEIYCTGSDCNFVGMAQKNDYNDAVNGYNRWGLFQDIGGVYLWKGLMSIGQSGTSAIFNDSNKSILIDETPAVYASFNRIEIRNAGTSVTWDGIAIRSLGTVSPGQFEAVENATIAFSSCTFIGMSTFSFDTNSTILACTFQGCGIITTNGADMTGSIITGYEGAAGTSALVWDEITDPNGELDEMTFTKGTAATHAIQFGSNIPATITLTNIAFSGYNASDSQNDSTLYFADTVGTITVNLSGCTGNISYDSAGCTVSFVINPVPLTITVKTVGGTAIEAAEVMVQVADNTNYPFEDSVSISRTGTTATVTHTGHGLETNDWVRIKGCVTVPHLNGVRQITYASVDTYTYVCEDAGGTSDTGGDATLAIIRDDTNISGIVTASRTYATANQPISGWARKSSSSPYYKQTAIAGTIDKDSGLSIEIRLILDQ